MFNDSHNANAYGDGFPKSAARPRPWNLAATATVAADGTATVILTMPAVGDYFIDTTSISLSVVAAGATCKIYRESEAQINFVEGTAAGSGDTSNTRHRLVNGQTLIAVWAGATAGTMATCRVSGLFTPAFGV